MLVLAYSPLIECSTPAVKRVTIWPSGPIPVLQDCFEDRLACVQRGNKQSRLHPPGGIHHICHVISASALVMSLLTKSSTKDWAFSAGDQEAYGKTSRSSPAMKQLTRSSQQRRCLPSRCSEKLLPFVWRKLLPTTMCSAHQLCTHRRLLDQTISAGSKLAVFFHRYF